MEQIKELKANGSSPLFDKTNMFYKEFPSDYRQIRYFTLLIVQSAPPEIKELNLLEQQISEIIKNAVNMAIATTFPKRFESGTISARKKPALLWKMKGKVLRNWNNGMNSTGNAWNVSMPKISKN